MKFILAMGLLLCGSTGLSNADGRGGKDKPNGNNVFIITLDGFRWQELFFGADPQILSNPEFTKDTTYAKAMFWHDDEKQRRSRLMPFVWNVVAKQGQLFGNRKLGNFVNTKNLYAISYPGYNEIFTGEADLFIANNKKVQNRNVNLLEYLNKMPQYQGRIAAFASWNVFSYILNKDRSKVYVNNGYEPEEHGLLSKTQMALNRIQQNPEFADQAERNDLLTFLAAKEYIIKHKPKVLHIGLGGTDSYGHQRRYDDYLKEANGADKIMADLWSMVQHMPEYKNNITFIITTDHGRGNRKETWYRHNAFTSGSSQTWIMMMGKGIKPIGEVADRVQLYQKHIAGTAGYLLGVKSYSKQMIPLTYFDAIEAAN